MTPNKLSFPILIAITMQIIVSRNFFLVILYCLTLTVNCRQPDRSGLYDSVSKNELNSQDIDSSILQTTQIIAGEAIAEIRTVERTGPPSLLRFTYMFYDTPGELKLFQKHVNELIVKYTLPSRRDVFYHNYQRKIQEEWFQEKMDQIKDDYFALIDKIGYLSEWYYSINIMIDENYWDFVRLTVNSLGYMGGAHEFRNDNNYLVDREKGRRLFLEDVVVNKSLFTKFAEEFFRNSTGMRVDQSYDNAGFWFEHGFFCPENFFFTEEEMVFHYNEYEIGSYMLGDVSFGIPIADLSGKLKISLNKI